jgi:hypothetical protein
VSRCSLSPNSCDTNGLILSKLNCNIAWRLIGRKMGEKGKRSIIWQGCAKKKIKSVGDG